jgi:hypothetical protein
VGLSGGKSYKQICIQGQRGKLSIHPVSLVDVDGRTVETPHLSSGTNVPFPVQEKKPPPMNEDALAALGSSKSM